MYLENNLKLKKELRFRDGKFKIALFSDIHGKKILNPKLKRDFDAMVEHIEPDLVLFSGDMFDLRAKLKTEADVREFLDRFLEILEYKNIPWANVYGNHEREGAFENKLLQPIFESYKNCISKEGPEDIHGTSNFMLPVKDSKGENIIFNVWGLDSGCTLDITDYEHSYQGRDVITKNPLHGGEGYDNPNFDQAMWYFISSKELEAYQGRKVPSIMFFHIPLPEFLLITRNPSKCNIKGGLRETVMCCEIDHGLFAACLMRNDVKGIYVGHDHVNDFSGKYCGIEMGYNAALCYDEYNDPEVRGCRIFEISEENPAEYNTYILRAKDVVENYYE